MNELFANLLTKNSNSPSVAVLQPRLPSQYETPALGDAAGDSMGSFPVPEIPSRALEFGEDKGEIALRLTADQTERTGKESSAENIHQPGIQKVDRHIESNPPPLPIVQEMSAKNDPVSPQRMKEHTRNIVEETSQREDDLQRRETVMTIQEMRESIDSSPNRHVSDDEAKALVVHPTVKSMVEQNESSLVHSSPEKKNQKSSFSASSAINPQEIPKEVEAPEVRVHIGRIEVKAVYPAHNQSSVKPAPAQPKMTLEDYLHHREGRR